MHAFFIEPVLHALCILLLLNWIVKQNRNTWGVYIYKKIYVQEFLNDHMKLISSAMTWLWLWETFFRLSRVQTRRARQQLHMDWQYIWKVKKTKKGQNITAKNKICISYSDLMHNVMKYLQFFSLFDVTIEMCNRIGK